MIRIAISAALIVWSIAVTAVAIFGLFRFRDALERIHAGAIIDTLSVLLIVVAVAVLCGFTVTTLKLIVLLIILWLTNPISSHLIARMELITGRDIDPDAFEGEGEEQL